MMARGKTKSLQLLVIEKISNKDQWSLIRCSVPAFLQINSILPADQKPSFSLDVFSTENLLGCKVSDLGNIIV